MKKHIMPHLPTPVKISFDDICDSLIIHDELNSIAIKLINRYNDTIDNQVMFAHQQLINNPDADFKDLFPESIENSTDNSLPVLEAKFRVSFEKLYTQSVIDNYYWQYCPFRVYEESFKERQLEYLRNYTDATEEDFYKDEINEMKDYQQKFKSELFDEQYKEFVYSIFNGEDVSTLKLTFCISGITKKQISNSTKRKVEYINFLSGKSVNKKIESPKPDSAQISNRHHQIFNNGGYDLFLYLVQNYTRDDKTPKAKFSNLFHYLKHEQLILCTQLQYISFIEEELKVKLSKILPSNYKYSEQIQPILGRLRSDFLQNLKA